MGPEWLDTYRRHSWGPSNTGGPLFFIYNTDAIFKRMLPNGLFTPLLERCPKMKDAHASAAEMASLIDGEPSSQLA
jgi:hypothetical protein